ncbi:MAG TPA: alpha/beta fold hydrolase [Acidimicrobiales bacterium]|nr:alpha/beta fold hydrolase [Acidimicrobiales bacterium]
MRRRILWTLLVVLAVAVGSLAGSPADADRPPAGEPLRPIVFVHGGSGSGAQFDTQALRFTSNGYPADLIHVHEYDSTFGLATMAEVQAGLDALIDEVLAETGADGVDLLGHSLGTAVSQGYLSTPERAAKVAHYVNIDGRPAGASPGGVETLAVWGEGNQADEIVGAENYYAPDQSHVQVATSAETFEQIHRFFTGEDPTTTDVVPEPPGRIRLSGEANLFPQNEAAEGFTLRIHEIDGRTGERTKPRPEATLEIGPDGAWGPFKAHGRKHYEFELERTDGSFHHIYFQPFLRSDHLVRLLTTRPGEGLDLLRQPSEVSGGLGVIRYKEMWGDQGADNDTLEINGVNVLSSATAPRSARVNAMFVFDDGVDGVTDLSAPVQPWFSISFLSAADLVIPAAEPPDGTTRVEMVARAGDGDPEVINIPNWNTANHTVTLNFRDFQQEPEALRGPFG